MDKLSWRRVCEAAEQNGQLHSAKLGLHRPIPAKPAAKSVRGKTSAASDPVATRAAKTLSLEGNFGGIIGSGPCQSREVRVLCYI